MDFKFFIIIILIFFLFEYAFQKEAIRGNVLPTFAFPIFLGSYLLFLIQPLIGKYILPWYGGTPNVWMTCLLFFQFMLLCGYFYAHLLTSWFRPRQQAIFHMLLIIIVYTLLPITPSDSWKGLPSENPTWIILGLLMSTVGGPFFVLSASAPLLQKWFSLTNRGCFPFRLYALSNLASMGALISYPFMIERSLRLPMQSLVWSGVFLLYGITMCCCAWHLFKSSKNTEEQTVSPEGEERGKPFCLDQILWVALSASGTLLLMSTTSQITQEVAPVPLLWVLPLAIYLLTFVICFDHPKWYYKQWFALFFVGVIFLWIAALFIPTLHYFVLSNAIIQIFIYSLVLLAGCMCCHGELIRRIPTADYLTQYYLLIALGGALGGGFIVLAAPNIFNDYREYQLSIGCILILLLITGRFQTLAPKAQKIGIVGLSVIALTVFVLVTVGIDSHNPYSNGLIASGRNFYGSLQILEVVQEFPIGKIRTMVNGATLHGIQFRSPESREIPTSYYDKKSCIGLAIETYPKRLAGQPINLGIIGLGTGTLAAYAKKNDTCVFYEINPLAIRYCLEYFTFVDDAKKRGATVYIHQGDGRLELEHRLAINQVGGYDILAIDAFSSDSIPIHLLTRECFDVYWQHLAQGGILAFHVSNRYLDLRPVIYRHALDRQAIALYVKRVLTPVETNSPVNTPSDWVLITTNSDWANQLIASGQTETFTLDSTFESWTDDFSSLVNVLR